MANVKISALPDATSVGTADEVPIVQSGVTKRATVAEILANVTGSIGVHTIPIMASGMSPSSSGGSAALATVATTANRPDISTLDFDATTAEYAQFSIPMPNKWNKSTITATFLWSHAATTVNFGVVWGIQAVAVSNDDTIDVAYGTAVEVTDTGGTTNDLYVSPATGAMTVGGTPADGDVVFFRVYRLPTDAGDTMAIDARLHGVILTITTDQETDA